MQQRTLGRTGLNVSVLSFGCGAVGGLMVRGSAADQERAVARALELGINYFDTAPLYGNGESERNLGRVLRALRPSEALVGTKVMLAQGDLARAEQAITAALDASLQRLGQDSVDLYQLHNPITLNGGGDTLAANAVIEHIAPAFARLRKQGKFRYCGFTALGETAALQRVLDTGVFDTAQIVYNLLNPSAGAPIPTGYPAHDYGELLQRARENEMGTIGIRVLAGGALSGSAERHPLGMPVVDPLGTGADYAADVRRAKQFEVLVKEGRAKDLVEAALRYAISHTALTTTLVGLSTLAQLEHAAASVNLSGLPGAAMRRVAEVQKGFVGQVR